MRCLHKDIIYAANSPSNLFHTTDPYFVHSSVHHIAIENSFAAQDSTWIGISEDKRCKGLRPQEASNRVYCLNARAAHFVEMNCLHVNVFSEYIFHIVFHIVMILLQQ